MRKPTLVINWTRLPRWVQALILFLFEVEYVRVQDSCTSHVRAKFPIRRALKCKSTHY